MKKIKERFKGICLGTYSGLTCTEENAVFILNDDDDDCDVFSRVSLATRDKAFLENCHCHGHPHERMQEQGGDSDASDASCDVSDEKRDIHQLL